MIMGVLQGSVLHFYYFSIVIVIVQGKTKVVWFLKYCMWIVIINRLEKQKNDYFVESCI